MSTEDTELGPSLFETLKRSDTSDIAQDAAELALDSFLADGVIKDIPVVSTIIRLGKTAFTIRDYFLVRKVLAFLQGMRETTFEERQSFVKKVEDDKDYQRQVGETIIMLLDRFDHLDKSRLLARLFSAYIREEIDYDEFLRLSTTIDRAFIKDLHDLLDYFAGKTSPDDKAVKRAKRSLYTSDLSDFYVLTQEEQRRGGLEHPQIYHFNQNAIQLAKAILREKFQDERW